MNKFNRTKFDRIENKMNTHDVIYMQIHLPSCIVHGCLFIVLRRPSNNIIDSFELLCKHQRHKMITSVYYMIITRWHIRRSIDNRKKKTAARKFMQASHKQSWTEWIYGLDASVHLVPIFDISNNIKNVWQWFWFLFLFLFLYLLLCMPISSVKDKIRMMCILNWNHLVEPILITINYGSL